MKQFFKFLTVTLAVLTSALCATTAVAGTGVSAVNGVTLDVLANQGLLKLNGRIRVESGYLAGDYSGVGFSTNIIANEDTEFELFVEASYTNKVSIWVDGKLADTEMVYGTTTDYGKMIACDIKKGAHEITVIKESQLSAVTTAFFRFKAVRFDGTVESKVANKSMLIEVIGDSYSCGDGADAEYQAGVAWNGVLDDAITKSFGWYLSEMFDADFREVGRGGQGLDGTAAQESQSNSVTMPILYDYFNYADQSTGTKWTETRTPDLVVVELGANDACSASNKAAWVAIAKNFLIKLGTKYGGAVPIVWDFTNNKSYFYQGLREAIETDAELSCYGNIYVMQNYLNGNGSAALASQSAGHPDADDQYGHAERLYNFIIKEGVLGVTETVSKNQYVYYVSATGSDSNDGLSAATPKLTIASAITAAKAYVGGISTIPSDAEVVIKVTGEVKLTGGQSMTAGIEKGDLKFRADGSALPIVYETYNYDGTNRAVLRSDFKPVNGGNASTYVVAPVIFKNVAIRFIEGDPQGTAQTKYTVQCIYGQYGDITFDNSIIKTDSGATVGVFANNFSYAAAFHKGIIEGTEERHHTITFKNGVYNSTTGFNTIAALGGVSSLWVSSSLSYYEAPGLTTEIVVGNGAVMDGTKLFINTSNLNCKEAILTVKTGGKVVGNFKGTTAGKSSASREVKTNLTLNIDGGHFQGAFAMLGNYVNLTGDTKFVMTGGEIYVPAGTSEETNSIVLGGGFNTNKITGNEYKEIHGGILYVIGTDATYKNAKNQDIVYQSGIHMSGRAGQTVTGVSENKMTAGAILLLPKNSSSKNTASGVYFGLSGGVIQTEFRNIIEGGIIDVKQNDATIYFGGQATNAVFKKMTNIIGVQSEGDRSVGPVFFCGSVSLAAGWGQYGRTSRNATKVTDEAAITSDTVVIDTTIYGGEFNAPTYVAQTGSSSSTYYPRTEGSIECTIYGGRFNSDLTLVYKSAVYGHASMDIRGGFFKNIYGVTDTGLVTNGVSISISGGTSYGILQTSSKDATLIGPFNFIPLSKGKVSTLLSSGPALTVNITGGQGKMNLNFNDANSVLQSGETASVNVTGGKYQSVSGTYAAGAVKGGWFADEPDASVLASGYSVKTFTQAVDTLYTCSVEQTGNFTNHTHCVCGGFSAGVGAHTTCDATQVWTPVMSYKDLVAAVTSGASMDGYYYLTCDIQLKAAINILENQKLHICLNGYTITAAPNARAFSMYKKTGLNAQLDITDCHENREEVGKIQGGYYVANGANILVFSGSSMNLYNGQISGGQAGTQTTSQASYGAGGNVLVNSGCTFNMYGGYITDGQARRQGGNLHVGGTANIYGGEISNGRVAAAYANLTEWVTGGNVYVSGKMTVYGGNFENGKANFGGNIYTNSSIVIKGGTIKNGEALTANGGNILGDKVSKVTIEGGTIENGRAVARLNTATDKKYLGCGGNIYIQGGFVMTGGEVTGGTSNYSGGNILFNKDNTALTATISGGTISDGTARFGGNITVEGTTTETKKVTVSDTAVITRGKAVYNATGGDGHGGNFYLSTGGELTVSGGTISDGKAGRSCGGGNISTTGAGAVITISGGKIANAYAHVKGEKDAEVASIVMFANVKQKFTMTGGEISVQNDGQVALKVSSASTTEASVAGGYIAGEIIGSIGGYISGGYLTEYPESKYLADGYLPFTLKPAVVNNSISYGYEVAKGFLVVTTSKVKEGQSSSINLQGGGQYRDGVTANLVAPSEVGPYRFVEWQKEGGTALTTSNTYSITNDTNGWAFYALYEFAKTDLTLTVNGTNFKIQTKAPGAASFTEKICTENETQKLAAGTEVVLTYLGEGDFAAWTNETGKFVTTEKEYSFTLYADMKLGELVTKSQSETKATVTIVYMNSYNQVLKTVDAANVATDVPEIPAQIGKTIVGWSKTVTELQKEITETANGEAKVITVTPVYEDTKTEGTVTVYQMTAEEIKNYFATGTAVLDSIPKVFNGAISKTITVTADALEGYTFGGFADEDGMMLSSGETYQVRPTVEGVTIYAVYTTGSIKKAPKATVSFSGVVADGTVQVDVTRTLPEGYEVVEQGFLLATPAMGCESTTDAKEILFLESEGNKAKMVSKLDGTDGVASLRMRGLTDSAEVFAVGYLIYRNTESGETGVVYSDFIRLKKSGCTLF